MQTLTQPETQSVTVSQTELFNKAVKSAETRIKSVEKTLNEHIEVRLKESVEGVIKGEFVTVSNVARINSATIKEQMKNNGLDIDALINKANNHENQAVGFLVKQTVANRLKRTAKAEYFQPTSN